MLSYRHSFHAGNHADVLKHLILQRILAHLCKKEAPFCCIDTHAGAGGYDLSHAYTLKNKEFEGGIDKLWGRHDLPESMVDYVQLIKVFNQDAQLSRNPLLPFMLRAEAVKSLKHSDAKLAHYPGSPLLMQASLRRRDRLFCYELHSTDVELLTRALGDDRRVKILHADGLQTSLTLFPPVERRGLVFVDPSYEVKADYMLVVDALRKMHQRFATGIYALWYPVVDRKRNQALEEAIKATGIKDIVLFELGITADGAISGMTASGLILINSPWTLADEMRVALPWLADTLGLAGAGNYRIEQLAEE